jgi:hypothetical protein
MHLRPFGVESRQRGRGRQIKATLPKGACSDCQSVIGIQLALENANFEIT